MNRFDDFDLPKLVRVMTTVSDDYVSLSTPKQVGAWWNYHFNDDAYLTVGQMVRERASLVNQRSRRGTGRFVGSMRDRATGAVWCPAWAPLGSDLTTTAVRTDQPIPLSRVASTASPVLGVRP